MAEAAFTWTAGGRLRVATVTPGSETIIGRVADATLRIDDSTVSRQHARVASQGSGFVLENLSETNPAKVRGTVPARPVPLMDGDEIALGTVRLQFHHLAAADQISGPMCGHCGRENSSGEKDCWFCGTSLAYASSQLRTRRAVIGRLVEDGGVHDLFADEALLIGRDGEISSSATGDPAPEGGARIEATRGGLSVRAAEGAAIQINGAPASDGAVIETGDQIAVGDRVLVAIER